MSYTTRQCVGDGGLFECKNIVTITYSNLRNLPEPVSIGGRCAECRRRKVNRQFKEVAQ